MDELEEASTCSDSSSNDSILMAPTILLQEFSTCLMSKDYVGAQHLCNLIYEPKNLQMKEFKKLLALSKKQESLTSESNISIYSSEDKNSNTQSSSCSETESSSNTFYSNSDESENFYSTNASSDTESDDDTD
ncbi:hypothetical protein A3Q56_00813 [Intoshia linei]|uniref:Uncharacterized protein n=1 Tax=Intoshia linei TaxID=1819745 RepID=A0A177BCS3_9BILA|nr:hypothetical protein A3Q56_00813 [Intoshia linei]